MNRMYMVYKGKMIGNVKTGQTITFFKTGADTKGELLLMQSTYAPHSKEPPAHYHPFQSELFEVLSGELLLSISGKRSIVKAGEQFVIPANTIHSMWNASDKPVIVNWEVRPAMRTAAFLETVTCLALTPHTNADGKPVLLQAVAVATEFSKEFRLAKPPYIVQRVLFSLLRPLARIWGYQGIHKMPE